MKRLLAVITCLLIQFPSYSEAIPLKEGKSASTLVLFGASGDLTKRKLVPALVHLAERGELPESFTCIGVGRSPISDGEFREQVAEFLTGSDRTFWQEKFSKKFVYVVGSFDEDATYDKLKSRLQQVGGAPLFFLATPPSYFAPIIAKLDNRQVVKKGTEARVVIEKPFGTDLQSATALKQEISKHLDEQQIYLIDHYLGKSLLRNMLSHRFSNLGYENLWHKGEIEQVSITLSEDIGVGGRGAFWEETGMLRDVVQNHIIQIIALIGMEKPKTFSPDDIQREKLRVIEAIRPFPQEEIDRYVTRGQYGKGIINGVEVPAYLEEKDVSPESRAETFVSLKLFIDTPRWQNVPFTIKTGKRLAHKHTEIAVTFKGGHKMLLNIHPHEEITLLKKGESPKKLLPATPNAPEAYEELLNEAMRGDHSHFTSAEEQLAAWRLFTPVLKHWEKNKTGQLPTYPAGSTGFDTP